MSASITTASGVVVVTQVFPRDENGKISLPIPSDAPPQAWTCPAAPAKVSDMTVTFLRGEPQSLGIVQIFIGLVCVLLSLAAAISPTQTVQAPLFMGVTFVLSGSLAVAARRGTDVGLIRATLASSLLSALLALLGVGYLCWLLAVSPTYDQLCGGSDDVSGYLTSGNGRMRCIQMVRQLNRVLAGVRGLVLVLVFLEVCVAITLCVFSGKAISRHGRNTAQTVTVVESGSAPTANPSSVTGSGTALLDSITEETASVPPPYSP